MLVPIRLALAALGLAVFLSGPALEAQTTLKYKFKKGDTLQYAMQLQTKSLLRGEKELMAVEKQDIELSWHIDGVDDKGTATIRLKFDRVKLAFENGEAKGEVSSDAKEEPKEDFKAASANAKAMSKVEGTFTITSQGDIGDITVPASALKEIRAIPGWGEATETGVKGHLQAALKDSILHLPAEGIAKGKAWKHKTEGNTPYGPYTGDMEYTFDGDVQHDGRTLAKFQVKPNIKIKVDNDPKSEVTVTIKNQDAHGAAYFDNTAGRLVEVTTVQVIEVQAEVKGKTILGKKEVTNSFKLVKATK
jgi:hypothetical protein